MKTQPVVGVNVEQAIPFFGVDDMERSLRFYQDGLGFEIKLKWVDEGKLRWCCLQIGNAAVMLQEFKEGHRPDGKRGVGVTICFTCKDAPAIYREVKARGIEISRPFVGNNMWVTSVVDPDGYRLDFESPTDVPEETLYEEPAV